MRYLLAGINCILALQDIIVLLYHAMSLYGRCVSSEALYARCSGWREMSVQCCSNAGYPFVSDFSQFVQEK